MDIQEYETLKKYCGKGKSLYLVTRGCKKYPLTKKGELIYSYMTKHRIVYHCFCANIGLNKVKHELRPCFVALTESAQRKGNAYVANEALFLAVLEKCGMRKSELNLNRDVYHIPYSLIGKRASFKNEEEEEKEKEENKKEEKLYSPIKYSSLSDKSKKSMLVWIKKTKPTITNYESIAYNKFNRVFKGKVKRQVPFVIGEKAYFADLCIESIKTLIEIDGGYHYSEEQREKDEGRDNAFASIGYKTIRIPNNKVEDKAYIGSIIQMLIEREEATKEKEVTDDTPRFSLSEIRKYIHLHTVEAPAEYIYEYWDKKKWKTKKGTYITTQNISVAINVVNSIYYQKQRRKNKKKKKKL